MIQKELLSTFFVEFLDLFLPHVVSQIDRDSIQFLPQEVFIDVLNYFATRINFGGAAVR
ncbi:hypothetical protein GS682_00470 [Nostoc sp. B(2019)]|nr:hypothetical protein [Nostoc sp. B(2019)]